MKSVQERIDVDVDVDGRAARHDRVRDEHLGLGLDLDVAEIEVDEPVVVDLEVGADLSGEADRVLVLDAQAAAGRLEGTFFPVIEPARERLRERHLFARSRSAWWEPARSGPVEVRRKVAG